MRRTFRALAYVLAVSAGMTAASAVPSFAQTTTTTTAPAVKHVRKHHVLHPGIGSASSRNVGPTSSTAGGGSVPGSSAASGTPSVAGAPGAGNSGTGGK